MTREEFWRIVEASRAATSKSPRDGYMDRQRRQLVQVLSSLPPAEIVAFRDELLALRGEAYRWDLWGVAELIANGCGDDAFSDFRDWLISRGRETYERALADPATVDAERAESDVEDIFFEGFASAPNEAYENATGKAMPLSKVKRPVSPAGTPWDDRSDLQERFPELWRKYAGGS
jgi:hypothetical protein